MGQNEIKKTKRINPIEINKKRFNEAFLDIYITGKYNRLMDILIGERNDCINYNDGKNDINEFSENNDIGKSNIINNTNENYIFNDFENNETKGKNNFIEYISDFIEHKNEINSKENYIIKNSTLNWFFHFFCKEGFSTKYVEKIKEEINKNYDEKKNNILLSFIDSDSEIFNVIDIFKTINKEFHPLFIFIVNNKENGKSINNLFQSIKKYISDNNIRMINMRNITIKNILDLDKKDDEENIKSYILDIYLYFLNALFYYNNFGDDYPFKEFIDKNDISLLLNNLTNKNHIEQDNKDKGKALFNILIIGRPGVGKSTLVNLLSESKRSMEGKGISVTKYITRYAIKKYNISIYDSPGFEYDNDIKQIKYKIEELNKHLIKKRNQIHLIFYLINSQGGRDFFDTEKEIFKLLMDNKIHTYFLLTFCPDKEFGNEVKEVIERDLTQIFYQISQEKGIEFFEKYIKIYPVHLLDEINGSCNNFGLKTVLQGAYNQFKNYIIDEENILKLQKLLKKKEDTIYINDINKEEDIIVKKYRQKEIFDIINKNNENIIYRHITSINDVLSSAKNESEFHIAFYSLCYSFLGSLGYFDFSFLKSKIKKNLLLLISENYNKVVNKKEQDELIEINSEKINENYNESNIPFYSAYLNFRKLKNFGYSYIDRYSKELDEEGLNGISNYLIDLIRCYNKSIESLKELGNLFNE